MPSPGLPCFAGSGEWAARASRLCGSWGARTRWLAGQPGNRVWCTSMATFDGLKGFRTLSSPEREQVTMATREERAPAGKVLFLEGEEAQSLWAVKEGVVHIIKAGPDGRNIVLEVIPPGELFGAVVALDNRPYPATAVAVEDSVVWRLPATLARQLCQKHPTLRSAILDQVTSRLRAAHERLRSVALERVEQRLARAVLSLAEKIGERKDNGTVLSVTRQELADMVGTTVETAIRVTSRWQRAGIVSSARHQLLITDTVQLDRIAHGEE
jgi:CRP/FNR family transcriptional regulator, nitrogen oxide reductase regulator